MRIEWRATPIRNYRTRGFAGEFTSTNGWDMKAILQDPLGVGDGTVPLASAEKLKSADKPSPGDSVLPLSHQTAYEDGAAQNYATRAITALCLMRYREKRPKP